MAENVNLPCPICFDTLLEGSVITLVPCGHCYHLKCVEDIRKTTSFIDPENGRFEIQNSDSCPECRK